MSAETTNMVHIESEMSDSYLDYAMSVIVARALPDARDGLKPVHRRILYAMHAMGMRAGTDYKKSARIVGEVLGKFHPHGDAAVYDTMVRLVQGFAMRNPLLEGQGNFGSIDGDGPAAMRYTEVRMAALGEEMMIDIARDTVPFANNFDGTLNEPVVLPSKIPNLLINGASGIAVGMATSIPPHNLGEVCDALSHMLENWLRLEEITIEELMRFIPGPDFPTGGLLYQHPDGDENGKADSLLAAYQSGRGKISLRSRFHTEPIGPGRKGIVITELPYQVNKSTLVERIANLARSGRLEGLSDLRDESDRNGLRLVLELRKDVEPEKLLPLLYRYTPLQDTFSIILLALVDGEPRLLSLKRALRIFLEHRLVILRKRSIFELRKAEERAHILEGLLIALSKLDVVVDIIRRSRKIESARQNLRKALKISMEQASAILELSLGRLVALERRKIRAEYQENRRRIRELQALLGSDEQQRAVILEELNVLKEQYQDSRRTLIVNGSATSPLLSGELIAETTWIMLSASGKLGRDDRDRAPRPNTRIRDTTFLLQQVDTSQPFYLFTAAGNCCAVNPRDLPQVEQASAGQKIAHVTALPSSELVVAMLGDLPDAREGGYLLLVTVGGLVKRMERERLPVGQHAPTSAMNLPKGDQLLTVLPHDANDEIVLVSSSGRMICFAADQVRPSRLAAGGVRGMKLLGDGDRVVAAAAVAKETDTWFWYMTAEGLAGRTKLADFPRYQRGAQGVMTIRRPTDSRGLAAATLGEPKDRLLVISDKGRGRMIPLKKAPILKRGGEKPEEITSLRDGELVNGVLLFP